MPNILGLTGGLMNKLLIVLTIIVCIFVEVKVYGGQKYFCSNGWKYTPGQTAQSFCSQIGSALPKGSYNSSALEQWRKECIEKDFVQVKKEYSSGKCTAVKEKKYVDKCGATCTSLVDSTGHEWTASCSGGNTACLNNRVKQEYEQKLQEMLSPSSDSYVPREKNAEVKYKKGKDYRASRGYRYPWGNGYCIVYYYVDYNNLYTGINPSKSFHSGIEGEEVAKCEAAATAALRRRNSR